MDSYIALLGDAAFCNSLWMTFWYTALVVLGSTGLGLAVAILLTVNSACGKRHVHW
ncbi:hypothetical protein ACVXG7_21305 [Enterobacter hormaechei]